ncbi:MAG: glycoside hydrolase family 2 TIM barrel-domain containing protein [Mycoplasmoidaceae bacterium]
MTKFKLGCILISSGMGITIVVPPIVVAAVENNQTHGGFYRNINLNEGWTFRLNEDTQEQTINLPHDFSIIQDFKHSNRDLRDWKSSGTTGFLPGGVGYYHKDFVLPQRDNPTIILNFDGAYNDTTVTVNGQIVGNNRYGYNPFAFDISKYVVADGKTINKLDVTVRHDFITSSRWYPGSGIYRDVTISVLDKIHVANNGTYVTTPNLKETKGKDGTVSVEVEVQNSYNEAKDVYVNNRVVDAKGSPVTNWVSTGQKRVAEQKSSIFNGTLKVNNPKLWSDKTPNLYYVQTQVVCDDKVVDQYETRFGFRYFEFDKEGFKVNGQLTKLQGVCLHHDQGALGAAAYNDAIYRQLTIMKEMGMNAVRTSHNCPDQDFLRMCDELGLYVMDEAFDGWEFSKTHMDFGQTWDKEIGYGNQLIDATPNMQWHSFVVHSMVKRDRNCPSIFMWSLGNELHEGKWHDQDITDEEKQQIMDEMLGYADEMQTIAKNLDHSTTRWCGIALESNPNTGQDPEKDQRGYPKCQIALQLYNNNGLIGFNYQDVSVTSTALEQFDRVYGSETASAQNSRGYYGAISFKGLPAHDKHFRVSSYDVLGTHVASEALWRTLYFDGYGGQFVWTGFDYIGEPSPYCWNCEDDDPADVEWPYPNTSYFGIVDTCGFPKDTYYLYRANLRNDETTLHLVGSLNENNMYIYPTWREVPGFTPVDIYSNAPTVVIKRNGQQVATIKRSDADTSRAAGKYHVYLDTDVTITDTTNCKRVALPADSHNLYKRLAINPVGAETITAEAYDEQGQLISQTIGLSKLVHMDEQTVGQIEPSVDKKIIKADGKSLAYVTVDLLDGNGNLITDLDAQQELGVSWEGPGHVLGVDNGDQATDEKWQNPNIFHPNDRRATIKTYAGKALIIVCSDKTPGDIVLKISNGMTTAKVPIQAI